MKFRHFLLSCKLRMRAMRYRRKLNRQTVAMQKMQSVYERKLEETTKYYEYQLATERKRYEVMMTAMVDRICQKNDLHPVSIAALDLDDKVRPTLKGYVEPADDPASRLSSPQLDYFEELRNEFWETARDEGASESVIATEWSSREPEIIRDVLHQIQ